MRQAAYLNATNSENFAAQSLRPLSVAGALAYPDLARQPLLLMLLALYDADANALQHAGPSLARLDLDEQLFDAYMIRDVLKLGSMLTDEQIRVGADREWRRLSAVALRNWIGGWRWSSRVGSSSPIELASPMELLWCGWSRSTHPGRDLRC